MIVSSKWKQKKKGQPVLLEEEGTQGKIPREREVTSLLKTDQALTQ